MDYRAKKAAFRRHIGDFGQIALKYLDKKALPQQIHNQENFASFISN